MSVHSARSAPSRRATRWRRGLTLVEVSIASTIVTTVLLASAMGFGASLKTVDRAKSLSRGVVYAETFLEDLSALDYDAVLALNGNQFFDQTTAAESKFGIALAVFEAELDLVQVRARLTDLDTGEVLGTLTTQRSRR